MKKYEEAEFEVGMITVCNMLEGMDYEVADSEARKEYRELRQELREEG